MGFREFAEESTEQKATIKVYSNLNEVTLYVNGKKVETLKGDKIFRFKIKLEEENNIKVVSGAYEDTALIRRVKEKDQSYIVPKGG